MFSNDAVAIVLRRKRISVDVSKALKNQAIE